eukprot:TRINITY_DN67997_c4_g1_i1.p1 TRINITY_DN67997_c4_g1~~TRINITY_DN67997_c4_g1_i1.p1  ORF type:complete len:466 (+),score=22.07 TRINITY_DN67997_c4_g1_i1:179-1399(+)
MNPRKHVSAIRSVACNNTDTLVITGHADAKLRIWDCRTKHSTVQTTTLHQAQQPTKPRSIVQDQLKGHRKAVNGVVFQTEGNVFYTAGADAVLKRWQIDEFGEAEFMEDFFGSTSALNDLHCAVPTPLCVTVGEDKALRLWKVAEGKSSEFTHHEGPVNCVCMIDDAYSVTGDSTGTLRGYHKSDADPYCETTAAHGFTDFDPYNPVTAETTGKANFGAVSSSSSSTSSLNTTSPTSAFSFSKKQKPQKNGLTKNQPPEGEGEAEPLPRVAHSVTCLGGVPCCTVVASGSSNGEVCLWSVPRKDQQGKRKKRQKSTPEFHKISTIEVGGVINGLSFTNSKDWLVGVSGTCGRLGGWHAVGKGAKNKFFMYKVQWADVEEDQDVDGAVAVWKPTAKRAKVGKMFSVE